MAIYTRNKKGQLVPLKIPAIKGPKGDQGPKGDPGETVQSNWEETDNQSGAFIQNKPFIAKNLDDLEDVEASIVKDKDVLLYNDESQKWEATTLIAGENRNILSYNSNAKQWQPVPLFSDLEDNGVLSRDVQVIGTSVGNIKEGDVLSEGMTFTEFVEKLLIKQIPPVYTKPTIKLINETGTKFEIGSTVDVNLQTTYSKNDGGDILSYRLLQNNSELYSGNTIAPYSDSVLLNSNVQFKAEVTYDNGPIKNDNLDQPYPTGQILKETISNTITINAARAYWGYTSDIAEMPNVESIRRTDIKGLDLVNGSTIVVKAQPSSRIVVFAYPSTLRDCTKIRYEELGDDNNKTVFQQIMLQIPDASGINPITYRVYYYISPIEFGSEATFTLTV